MESALLNGSQIADIVLKGLREKTQDKRLKLVVVQVGNNEASSKYVSAKKKAALRAGVDFDIKSYPEMTSREELLEGLKELSDDVNCTGVIVQLPLPGHLRTQEILDAIPDTKDVDVLSSSGFGRFALGTFPILPPTVAAISLLLSSHGISLRGRNVLVIGSGRLVGQPVASWASKEKATVCIANSETPNLKELGQKADLIISGTGKSEVLTGDMISEGAVVIDAGTAVEDGKTVGDVHYGSVKKKASYLAPVPGGVGPLTVACLFRNLVTLSQEVIE